jgi:hypothetical protein
MSLAISVMEGRGGYSAILKACFLLRGKTSMALFLALLVNVALAAIPVILKRYLPIYSCWQKSNSFERHRVSIEQPHLSYVQRQEVGEIHILQCFI